MVCYCRGLQEGSEPEESKPWSWSLPVSHQLWLIPFCHTASSKDCSTLPYSVLLQIIDVLDALEVLTMCNFLFSTEEGKPLVLSVVKKAEQKIINNPDENKVHQVCKGHFALFQVASAAHADL